jgi:GntR family transcriptional regulator
MIMDEFGIALGTAREAVRVLRDDGLVVTEHGRGTIARPPGPARRRASERYRVDRQMLTAGGDIETPFTHDHHTTWTSGRLDRQFSIVAADDRVARLFDVSPGTALLERRFVFWAAGTVEQMSTSYMLADMVAGTPVADPGREPWPGGTIAQMHSLGIAVTGVRETVTVRRATPDESGTLRIASGAPVVVITRQMVAGDRIVEVAADIVMPADRIALEYWIPLD